MSWASYAADPSRPFWGVRVLRQRASVDVKNPGLGLIATRPGLEQLVDRRIAHRTPLSPRSTGHESPAKRGKSAADRRPSRQLPSRGRRAGANSAMLNGRVGLIDCAQATGSRGCAHEEASARDGGARRPVHHRAGAGVVRARGIAARRRGGPAVRGPDRRLQPRRTHRRGHRQRHREQPLGLPARPRRLRGRGRARRSRPASGPATASSPTSTATASRTSPRRTSTTARSASCSASRAAASPPGRR